jgi:hypothetical protein
MDFLYKKLGFNINHQELIDYYNDLEKNYEQLKWSWDKCKDDIKSEWQDRMLNIPGADLGWGWGIQSNIVDISVPTPPYNISTHELCEYRNTELAKGFILRLQEKIPYATRWGLFVQPPGGTVPKHSDQEDEVTIHIPIYWPSDAVFEVYHPDRTETITFPADGSAYILDTIIPHATFNRSNENRVGIVFRIKRNDIKKILFLQGQI